MFPTMVFLVAKSGLKQTPNPRVQTAASNGFDAGRNLRGEGAASTVDLKAWPKSKAADDSGKEYLLKNRY